MKAQRIIAFLPALAFLYALLTGGTNAAVQITGSIALGTAKFEITQDITFNITATGTARFINFDEWISANDGGTTFLSLLPDQLLISVNSQPDIAYAGVSLADGNWTGGQVTANDFYFFSAGQVPVAAGDTFTVRSGIWNIPASPNFPLGAEKTFVGNAYLSSGDGSGTRVSEMIVIPVPEPTPAVLYGIGALAGLLLRRRSA